MGNVFVFQRGFKKTNKNEAEFGVFFAFDLLCSLSSLVCLKAAAQNKVDIAAKISLVSAA